MKNYTIEKGKIKSNNGIPYAPRWFADNRISFQVGEQGIGDIDYFNKTSFGHYKVFANEFWGNLRFYIDDGRVNNLLCFKDCEIMPFGITGSCIADKIPYKLTMFAAYDTVFVKLNTGSDVKDSSVFKAEFYNTYRMGTKSINREPNDRNWDDFKFENNRLMVGYSEEKSVTAVCFSANYDMSFKKTAGNVKNILSSTKLISDTEYVFAISFDNSAENVLKRSDYALKSCHSLLKAQEERYEEVIKKAPVLVSPYEQLNNFAALAPLYHESLKTQEEPGTIRAKSTFYWMWGWDSITSSDAYYYWGDKEFVNSMLGFYQKFTDEKDGIAHAFHRDFSCSDVAPPPAQGMYITLLYLHYCNGGDIKQFYDFAKTIFNIIAKTEVRDLGLCKGTSLFPDYRDLMKETGNDISTFNNTVCYCAVRSMEMMAKAMGDTEAYEQARGMGVRMRGNFQKVLFNKEYGCLDTSVDSNTLQQRNVLSDNVKWENSFCGELLENIEKECMEFYEKNLVSPAGIRLVSRQCDAYDGDANQLNAWWLVMSELYTRLVNKHNKTELMEQFIGYISCWTEKLMCPEGVNCYNDTDSPFMDNWNSLNGTWHAYSMRGWYNALVHSIVGVEFTVDSLVARPYSGKEMKLLGLHFGDRIFDIHVCGSGCSVKSIKVNGKMMQDCDTVPLCGLPDKNTVVITRG